MNNLDWQKMNGLIPAIIQDADNGSVLMLGYMNKQALELSLSSGELTLFSRSRQELWKKGDTSGNTMTVISIVTDCDSDSLLVQVKPAGPACHLGLASCFQPAVTSKIGFLASLANLIKTRDNLADSSSYTAQLLKSGVERCAQKVGEEATETVIAAVGDNRDELIFETADLLFHLLVLLQVCKLDLYNVIDCLQERHQSMRGH